MELLATSLGLHFLGDQNVAYGGFLLPQEEVRSHFQYLPSHGLVRHLGSNVVIHKLNINSEDQISRVGRVAEPMSKSPCRRALTE